MMTEAYESCANELRDRIFSLIPDHPEIMEMDGPFQLFDLNGFSCSDLDPSLAQAGWALGAAQQKWREKVKLQPSSP